LNLGVKDGQEGKGMGYPTFDRPFSVSGATYKLNTPVGSAFITINQDENKQPMELFINIGKAGSDVAAMAEALGRTISTALRFRGNLSPRERAKEVAYQLAGIGGRRSVGFGPNKILSLPDAVAAALSLHFGFKVNGFAQQAANGVATGVKGTVFANEELKVGTQSDSAGAVMSALNPEPNGTGTPLRGNNDHTMASAESYLAPAMSDVAPPVADSKLEVIELKETTLGLISPEVSADICPSCGASSLVYEEGCAKCYSCGHSEC
jgi:ribonucleoside-diphosphate reductase alpha chain